MLTGLAIASAVIWLGLLAQPWQPWRMRERFAARAGDVAADVSDITVLIPARDEQLTLARTLAALSRQGSGLRVIVVDDNSADDTAEIARAADISHLTVLTARALPPGWTGKLWALEQGREHVTTPRVLLLDADIELAPGTLAGLRRKAIDDDRALVSLMAALRMTSAAERLLIPAFIYFFKLLYPFALSNRGCRLVAAAAGGCVLLDTGMLDRIGGFGALGDAIIDDCALAKRVRRAGGRTWVGVTHAAASLRGYASVAGIHAMVARSAYTQLRYSPWLLIAATLAMGLMFWAPGATVIAGGAHARVAGAIALAAMVVSYLPTLRYYGIAWTWALALPATGTLYLGMTWSSALRYWRGQRSAWRGRTYLRE